MYQELHTLTLPYNINSEGVDSERATGNVSQLTGAIKQEIIIIIITQLFL